MFRIQGRRSTCLPARHCCAPVVALFATEKRRARVSSSRRWEKRGRVDLGQKRVRIWDFKADQLEPSRSISPTMGPIFLSWASSISRIIQQSDKSNPIRLNRTGAVRVHYWNHHLTTRRRRSRTTGRSQSPQVATPFSFCVFPARPLVRQNDWGFCDRILHPPPSSRVHFRSREREVCRLYDTRTWLLIICFFMEHIHNLCSLYRSVPAFQSFFAACSNYSMDFWER